MLILLIVLIIYLIHISTKIENKIILKFLKTFEEIRLRYRLLNTN